MHQLTENAAYNDGPVRETSLWEGILGLVERNLAERRSRKLFVEIESESGPCCKEIGELSAAERRSLHPDLGERVAELLLDRYLAEQDRVDLVEKRRTYTKNVQHLTPEDLPALVEASRWKAEEERERVEFVRDMQSDLKQLSVAEPAGTAARMIVRQTRA